MRRRHSTFGLALLATAVIATLAGCGNDSGGNGGATGDVIDEGGTIDTAPKDTGAADTGVQDAGLEDTSAADTGVADSGVADSGAADSGAADSGVADTTTDGASGDVIPDVNPGTCPAQEPIGSSTTCQEGVVCNYGQECCCGKCHPSLVCTCMGGKFGCYATDACMIPPGYCDDVDAGPDGGDAGPTDTGSDTSGGGGLGASCTAGPNADPACAEGLYCALPMGQCAGEGSCANKPQMCTAQFDPVCGCDGKTHGNACGAASAGANIAAKGECAKPANLQWFTTCGDPVCKGWSPKAGLAECGDGQKAGLACDSEGATCDPHDACNAKLVCAAKDPKQNPGGCPISRAAYKTDIRFVAADEAQSLAQRLLQLRLATYRYKALGPDGRRQLGFLIDDDPASPAVDPARDMVDLYGYLSMAVATLQVQQRRIDALEAELRQLRRPATVPRAASRAQRKKTLLLP